MKFPLWTSTYDLSVWWEGYGLSLWKIIFFSQLSPSYGYICHHQVFKDRHEYTDVQMPVNWVIL